MSNPNRSNSAICPRETPLIDHSKVAFAESGRKERRSRGWDDLLLVQRFFHSGSQLSRYREQRSPSR